MLDGRVLGASQEEYKPFGKFCKERALSSRDWMAAALLPDAAVFTARSVT